MPNNSIFTFIKEESVVYSCRWWLNYWTKVFFKAKRKERGIFLIFRIKQRPKSFFKVKEECKA